MHLCQTTNLLKFIVVLWLLSGKKPSLREWRGVSYKFPKEVSQQVSRTVCCNSMHAKKQTLGLTGPCPHVPWFNMFPDCCCATVDHTTAEKPRVRGSAPFVVSSKQPSPPVLGTSSHKAIMLRSSCSQAAKVLN